MTALEIIQWLKEDGHINNKQAGILRRAVLDKPEGRWVKNKSANLDELGFVLCSNCRCGFKRYDRGTRKSELPWIDGQPYELENRCNYCPTCGAKMLNANGPTEEEGDEL